MHANVKNFTQSLTADKTSKVSRRNEQTESHFVTVWSADFEQDNLEDEYLPFERFERAGGNAKTVAPLKFNRSI